MSSTGMTSPAPVTQTSSWPHMVPSLCRHALARRPCSAGSLLSDLHSLCAEQCIGPDAAGRGSRFDSTVNEQPALPLCGPSPSPVAGGAGRAPLPVAALVRRHD
jgi:hypothetical protein